MRQLRWALALGGLLLARREGRAASWPLASPADCRGGGRTEVSRVMWTQRGTEAVLGW